MSSKKLFSDYGHVASLSVCTLFVTQASPSFLLFASEALITSIHHFYSDTREFHEDVLIIF